MTGMSGIPSELLNEMTPAVRAFAEVLLLRIADLDKEQLQILHVRAPRAGELRALSASVELVKDVSQLSSGQLFLFWRSEIDVT